MSKHIVKLIQVEWDEQLEVFTPERCEFINQTVQDLCNNLQYLWNNDDYSFGKIKITPYKGEPDVH